MSLDHQRIGAPERHPAVASAPGRDVFVDAVRALGTLCIVTVHWLMPDATWDGRDLVVGNALGHGAGWVVTWLLQALPLMFFAAGAAAAYAHARSLPAGSWMWRRTVRARLRGVVRPVVVFAGAWMVGIAALLAFGAPAGAVWPMARIVPQLLWFLAVWAVLLAMTPALVRLWRRWGWWAVAGAVVAPMLVDLPRFGAGAEWLAWTNVVLVWTLPFLLGVAYADARATGRGTVSAGLTSARRWRWVALVAVGAAVALIVVGPYPWSMIGMPGDPISNLGPPTAPVVAHAVAQVATVLAAREAIVRWAHGQGRAVVGRLARHSMTVYLWHLTAMFAVVGVVLVGLGRPLPEPWSGDWWGLLPVWFVCFGVVLAVLVALAERVGALRARQRMNRVAV